jgi:3-oxoacyl-[acyl-carrier protein] reductase
MSLSGKVAVITGGTKGIGRAIAQRLAKDGASIVVSYGSDSKSADSLVIELGSDQALAVMADASTITGNKTLVEAAVQKFGKIDILIPNAGVMPMATLADTTEESFDKTFAFNVKGPYFRAQVLY